MGNVMGFCSKFHTLSSSAKILKIRIAVLIPGHRGMRHSIELRDLRTVGRRHRQSYTCVQCTVSAQAQSAEPASRKICVSPSLLTEELELETQYSNFKCLLIKLTQCKNFKNTTPM